MASWQVASALALVPLVACGGKAGPADAGTAVSAQAYFGLAAGRCFEYAETDGGAPDLGLKTVADPTRLELHLLRHGLDSRVDYLGFDGGTLLLEQQELLSGGQFRSRIFTPALVDAQAPLAAGAPTLSSTAAWQDSVAGQPAGSGQESWQVDVLSEAPWTGPAGSYPQAFELSFTADDGTTSAPSVERRWAVPDVGFVDLYLPDDTGTFVDYRLVDVRDAGPSDPCAAN